MSWFTLPGMESIAWWKKGLAPKQRLAFFISTAGGAGLSPVAPGTAGSIVATILFLFLLNTHWAVQLFFIFAILVGGLWAARVTEENTHVHDDGRIVVDEVCGMWITLFTMPLSMISILFGFLLFRVLDIFKPYPANYIDQKWIGARGVVFDDVVSGIYALAILQALHRLSVLL